jgi:hypothetical protein
MRSTGNRYALRALLLAIVFVWGSRISAQAPLPYGEQPPPPSPPPAAQPKSGRPPLYPPAELDRIVSPVALYPDPLLAQLLGAATFPTEIPPAAQWADEHHYLTGDALAQAIAADHLPWDPIVQALLPFPSVLEMMASDMPWTEEIGNAFLPQRQDLMDAVQRMRAQASHDGYLRSNAQIVVTDGSYVSIRGKVVTDGSDIEILPADPNVIVVPSYNPAVVFAAPPRGGVVTGAIRLGFSVRLGAPFAPWGWSNTRFDWGGNVVFINGVPWGRMRINATTYQHPYALPHYTAPRPPDAHRLVPRSARERDLARTGRAVPEEHRR